MNFISMQIEFLYGVHENNVVVFFYILQGFRFILGQVALIKEIFFFFNYDFLKKISSSPYEA